MSDETTLLNCGKCLWNRMCKRHTCALSYFRELAEKLGFCTSVAQQAFSSFASKIGSTEITAKKKRRNGAELCLIAQFYASVRQNRGQITIAELSEASGIKKRTIWKELKKTEWAAIPITPEGLLTRYARVLKLTGSQRLRLQSQLKKLSRQFPGMSPKTLLCFCVHQELQDDIIYRQKAEECTVWLCNQMKISESGLRRVSSLVIQTANSNAKRGCKVERGRKRKRVAAVPKTAIQSPAFSEGEKGGKERVVRRP